MAFQRLKQISNVSASGCNKKNFFYLLTVLTATLTLIRSSDGQLGITLINKIWAKEGDFHLTSFGLLRKLFQSGGTAPPPVFMYFVQYTYTEQLLWALCSAGK